MAPPTARTNSPEVTFSITCSTGTYIRTLGDDIARALGGRAHLTALRRTRNGSLSVSDAVSVSALAEAVTEGRIGELIIEASDALGGIEQLTVDDPTAFRVRNGRPMPCESSVDVDDGEFIRVADDTGALIAVYRRDGEQLLPEVVLA